MTKPPVATWLMVAYSVPLAPAAISWHPAEDSVVGRMSEAPSVHVCAWSRETKMPDRDRRIERSSGIHHEQRRRHAPHPEAE